MLATETKPGLVGMIALDTQARVIGSMGAGTDSRVKAMTSDSEWLAEARDKRIVTIKLTDRTLTGLVTETQGGSVILFWEALSDTVLNFLLNVDFAFDIIDHILTDPYDAMAIVDADEKLVFISPVHEKFFGLQVGEAVGKYAKDVIENSRLHHVVRTGVAEVGQIQKMRGRERVVSRHPIRHEGKIVGAIGRIMFAGPQQVEELSRRVNALEQEISTYKAEASEERRRERFLDAIIGQSFAIHSVRQQIRKIAPLDVPVLIQGESGTGKELVAQALHMLSPRYDGRLISVNAAALPASLVESELFGYEAGSFTGADKKGRPGKFELADKGTIFLDEIGDMPLEVQSKLLRVLQDRMVERVGSDKPKRVDFRLCSATNRDLEQFIEQGKFRLDLFYRISPVTIVLPSLDERMEDVPLLLRHFLQDLSRQYNRPQPEVDAEVHEYLMARQWPGNVRQLRHEVERAFVFCEDGILRVSDFSKAGAQARQPAISPLERGSSTNQDAGPLRQALEQVENDLIANAMARFKGNKKKVAEHLGVSRSYLYKKLGVEGD